MSRDKEQIDMLLMVRGDSNDADFVTEITPITQEELDKFAPLFEALNNFQPYKGLTSVEAHVSPQSEHNHDNNWPKGEYGYRSDLGEKSITELYGELAEEFDEKFVPDGGESNGYSLHDIVEIVVVKLDKKVFTAKNHYKNWAIF
jgi:hypothetical protein